MYESDYNASLIAFSDFSCISSVKISSAAYRFEVHPNNFHATVKILQQMQQTLAYSLHCGPNMNYSVSFNINIWRACRSRDKLSERC